MNFPSAPQIGVPSKPKKLPEKTQVKIQMNMKTAFVQGFEDELQKLVVSK